PDHLDARINRAGLLCELGQHDAARRDVDAGLALDPDNPHLRCLLGRLHAESGEAARARDAYTAALNLDSGFAEAWASRGVAAFELGDVDAAIADLSHALDLTDDPTIRYNRATAYQAHRRWADAVDDLTAALARGAEAPEVYLKRGTCLIALGDPDRARDDLLRCVRLDADQADDAIRLLPTLADVLAPVAGRTSP
ncbi:MAG TPA: tetratricopeptide repeat protein, partial [Mycobacteriales bacterium]|nr:tetratricopeptide repeat protein [Mycobacteriales bacterium]